MSEVKETKIAEEITFAKNENNDWYIKEQSENFESILRLITDEQNITNEEYITWYKNILVPFFMEKINNLNGTLIVPIEQFVKFIQEFKELKEKNELDKKPN